MKQRFLFLFLLVFSLTLTGEPLPNRRLAPPHKDQKGPQIGAVFCRSTYFPVYRRGERVILNCYVKNGVLAADDVLVWKLFDWRKTLVDSGRINVTPKQMKEALDLEFKPEKAGCYFVELNLEKSRITIPWEGSRPKGYVTFGILPELQALPLKKPEDSRFGMCGITNIEEDKYAPLGTMLGIHWADYVFFPFRKEKSRGEWKEVSKEEVERLWRVPYPKSQIQNLRSAARHQIATLNFLHGLPHHLVKVPDELRGKKVKALESAYIYNDPAYYRDLIGRMVRTVRNFRETKLTYMTRSRYLIHWEPDWSWRGSTDEFLQMYRDASRAIRENDPSGMLLGTNHGVLERAVPRMSELFEKGLADFIQGVAVHLYFLPVRALPEEKNLHGNCREMRRLTDRWLGRNAPLMNTEWGTCAVKTLLVDHPLLMNHMYRFIRGHLIALGEGFTTTYFFYSTDYNFIGYPDGGEHGYGMTFNLSWTNFGGLNCQPKPTYMAAAAMTRLLEGTQALGRLDYLDSDVFVYSFRRGSENLLVVWSPYGEREVRLRTGRETIRKFDIMGNFEELVSPDGMLTLRADEYPVYLLGISDYALATAPRSGDSVFRVPVAELAAGASLQEVLSEKGRARKLSFLLHREGRDSFPAEKGCLPKEIVSGPRLLEAYDENGSYLESMMVNVLSPIRITELEDIAGKEGRLSAGVHLSNSSAEERTVSVQLSYGKKPGPVKTCTLKPGENKVLPFDVTRLYQGRALTELSAAAFSRYGLETEFLRPNWGVTSATELDAVIDGRLEEWPETAFSARQGKELLVRAEGWRGNGDFSVRYQTAASEKGVAVALEVWDDVDCFQTRPETPWRADGLLFAVGLDSDRRGSWERIRFFSIGRGEDGNAIVHSMIGLPPNQQLYRIGREQLNAAVRRVESEKKTIYEFFLPWKTIGEKSSCFGLGIALMDADSPGDVTADRHREINLMGGIPFFMSSARMGTILRHP